MASLLADVKITNHVFYQSFFTMVADVKNFTRNLNAVITAIDVSGLTFLNPFESLLHNCCQFDFSLCRPAECPLSHWFIRKPADGEYFRISYSLSRSAVHIVTYFSYFKTLAILWEIETNLEY